VKSNWFIGLGLALMLHGGYAAAELRIGYLDVSRVVEESPQYNRARKSLQRELKRRQNDLNAKAKQLQKLENKLKRDAEVMSAAEAKRLERDILSRRRKLKNAQAEYRDDLALRQNEERTKLLRQVSEVVREIGKKERFDLILTDGVAFHSKRVDISDRVLQRLKQKARGR